MRTWVVVLMVALLATSAAIAAEKESNAPACPNSETAAAAKAESTAPPAEEIVAGGIVIMRLRGVIGGKTPQQRAGALYERLNTIISDRTLKPGDYRAVKKGKDWLVMAGKTMFVTVTNQEAAANKVKPEQLAAVWAKNLRKAVARARPIPLPWEEEEASQ
jgi:hypothetical protein